MNCGVFSQNTWLFPDSVPSSGKKEGSLSLLKGQTGAFQVIVDGLTVGAKLSWRTKGLSDVTVTLYREKDVCVNRNTNENQDGPLTTDRWEVISEQRVRKAPYRVYDALVPVSGLPAGDTHIVYPGIGEPLRSPRFMQMMCGIEDYEILRSISEADKATADGLCRRAMRSFIEYTTDVEAFDALQKELVEVYDEM